MKTQRIIALYLDNASLKRLDARWKTTDEPYFEAPYFVSWSDGRPATVDDFRRNEGSAYCITRSKTGEIQKHMFPDIVAEARFEKDSGDWVVSGAGVIRAALDLRNQEASDSEIHGQAFNLPIIYAIRIFRD